MAAFAAAWKTTAVALAAGAVVVGGRHSTVQEAVPGRVSAVPASVCWAYVAPSAAGDASTRWSPGKLPQRAGLPAGAAARAGVSRHLEAGALQPGPLQGDRDAVGRRRVERRRHAEELEGAAGVFDVVLEVTRVAGLAAEAAGVRWRWAFAVGRPRHGSRGQDHRRQQRRRQRAGAPRVAPPASGATRVASWVATGSRLHPEVALCSRTEIPGARGPARESRVTRGGRAERELQSRGCLPAISSSFHRAAPRYGTTRARPMLLVSVPNQMSPVGGW